MLAHPPPDVSGAYIAAICDMETDGDVVMDGLCKRHDAMLNAFRRTRESIDKAVAKAVSMIKD